MERDIYILIHNYKVQNVLYQAYKQSLTSLTLKSQAQIKQYF